jgi:predicted DNA-binding transcriptional regulator YafY
MSAANAEAADRTAGKPARDGWVNVTIPIESVEHAAGEIVRLGAEAEVIEPAELRARIAETAREMARLYRVSPASSGKRATPDRT